MRNRLVRPDYWSDVAMAKLPIPVRHTYIGLWCLTDDAGFLEWDPELIAGELYRHEEPVGRLARVRAELEVLAAAGRLRILTCGRHAVVPTIPEYRMQSGEALYTIKKRHSKRCELLSPTEPYVGLRQSESESESESKSPRARARGAELSPEASAAWRELGQTYGGKPNGH